MVNDIKIYIKLMCENILDEDYRNVKENAKFILKHLNEEVNP